MNNSNITLFTNEEEDEQEKWAFNNMSFNNLINQ